MNKKALSILSISIMVILIVFFCAFHKTEKGPSENDYSSLCTDLDSIINNRKEGDIPIGEINFNGIPLTYDSQSRCFFYSLSKEENAYDPKVSWLADNVEVAFENKEINDSLISNNERIAMVIYDNDRYSLNYLVCTTLPIINIDKFYDNFSYEYERCSFEITDNGNEQNRFNVFKGEARIRGGTMTAELPKPGLRIKLDKVLKGDNNVSEKYYEIFGLEPDNEFVLYTCNIEKDHIRNVFTTNLWYDTCADDNDLGVKLGMSYRYCEVFVNNKYWGLCALGNPISEKRHYVDLDKDSDKYPLENIYKLNFFGDRERMDYEKYGNDYLFFKKTNEDKEEAWGPFIDFMKLLLYSKDNEEFYKSINIDNAVDIYLFYNMTQAWDNAWFEDNLKFRNTYLISKVQEDGSIRMYYIPWDLDRCWGHEREDGLDYPMDYTRNYDMVMNPVENLLNLDDPQIKELIYTKYKNLRNGLWSDEEIKRMLDEYEKQAYGSGAYFREYERWPENYHADNKDLKSFKEYVMNRVHFFDGYVEEKFSG